MSVLTNLNDPLGNIKSLYESDTFSMLGFIHKEYAKMKEKLGFIGCPLPDVQQKIKEIIEQHSQSLEKSLGVDEVRYLTNPEKLFLKTDNQHRSLIRTIVFPWNAAFLNQRTSPRC